MAFNLEEQEKISTIKAWWDRWGNLLSVVSSIVLFAVLAWYGWKWYQKYEADQALGYFEVIESASQAPTNDSLQRIDQASKVLQDSYASTVYASRGLLIASNFYMNHNNSEKAKSLLQWLLNHSSDAPAIVPIAKLRLASLEIDAKQFDKAQQLLNHPATGFEALYLDRQGDLALAQGDKAKAISLWQQATQTPHIDSYFAQTIQLKINALGGDK